MAATPLAAADDLCRRVLAEQPARLAKAVEAASRKQLAHSPSIMAGYPSTADVVGRLSSLGLTCLPFPGGAWALEVEAFAHFTGEDDYEVVPVAYREGRRVAAEQASIQVRVYPGGPTTTLTTSLASDYDGDGVPEFYAQSYEPDAVPWCGIRGWGRIFTLSRGAVSLYGPARFLDIGLPKDIDGDGRLDLPTVGLQNDPNIEPPCGAEDFPRSFIAHALPNGLFSANDTVAKSWVLAWCPAPPAQIASAKDAVCARLWASTPAAFRAARALAWASCADYSIHPRGQDEPRSDCATRGHVFAMKVPFTLP
jgi:hypothetical protein